MVGFGHYRRTFRFRSNPRAENQQAPFGCLLIVVVPLLFVVSAWFSWREFRFLIHGVTADAAVHKIFEIAHGRSRRPTHLAVRYSFYDRATGQLRAERDDVPLSWPKPAGTVRVQYIPGAPGDSRLAGHRNWVALIFFGGCVVAAAWFLAVLWKQARRAVAESEAFERERRREGR